MELEYVVLVKDWLVCGEPRVGIITQPMGATKLKEPSTSCSLMQPTELLGMCVCVVVVGPIAMTF